MNNTLKFDQKAFEAWFVANAQAIYDLTGVAHYNALNIGLLKLIFTQEQRIAALEAKPKRKKKEATNG